MARVRGRLTPRLSDALGAPRMEGGLACFPAGDVEVVAPWTADAAERLEQEIAFLRRFGGDAPVAVPVYEDVQGDAELPVAIRRRPPGILVDAPSEGLADGLAGVVAWLHAIPPEEALAAGVRVRTTSYHNFARLYGDAATVYGLLRPVLDDGARGQCDRFFADGTILSPHRTQRVVHGRLGRGVVWQDSATGSVSCVAGWGYLAFGDPAATLFRLYQWGGPAFLEAMARRWAGADDGLLARVRFLSRCAALLDLHSARGGADGSLAAVSLRALRWA